MSKSTILKYRPVLTQSLITHTLNLAKSDLSPKSLELISVLAPYEHKILNQSVKPATSIETIDSKLGLELESANSKESRKDLKRKLYLAWSNSPIGFNRDELELINEFRFESELMSESEIIDYSNYLMEKAAKDLTVG